MSRDHRLFARLETDIACTALFLTYLPTPLVLLTDRFGIQTVHIAPEAFTVASAEFGDEVQTWQDALPGSLKGQLASVFGQHQSLQADTDRTSA